MCEKKVVQTSVFIFLAVIAAFIIYKVVKTQPLENQVSYQAKRPPNVAHWAGLALWSENALYAFEREVKLGVDEIMFHRPQILSHVIKRFDLSSMTADNTTAKSKNYGTSFSSGKTLSFN